MKYFLALLLIVCCWMGCQSYDLSVSPSEQATVKTPKIDATLRSLSQENSVFKHIVPHDKHGSVRLLVELRSGHSFPSIEGLRRYGNVGRIYSASATPEALRKLFHSEAILRAEASPRYRLRRTLGTSSMLVHSASIDPAGTPKQLTYNLTVATAGKVSFKVMSEVVDNQGPQEKWAPKISLCPTTACTTPSDSDFGNFGTPDPNDKHATPQSHASLTHTFAKGDSLFVRVESIDTAGGKFVLIVSSNDIDLATSQLTGGDITATKLPRRSGTGAGSLRTAQSVDGTGVIVGVIDSGIDWCHKDFIRNNKSQVLFLWDVDLVAQGNETSPDPKVVGQADYGVEYTKAQIEAAMGTCDRTKVRSYDTNGHGTHVAGIAAGGGTQPGMAPGADLIIVKGLDDIVSAMKYIIDKAKTLKRPVAINMSLGGHDTSHDGTALGEKAIEQSIAPGINIAVAAGNEGGMALHATTTATLNQATTLRYQAMTGEATINLNLFTDKADEYTITAVGLGQTLTFVWGQASKATAAGIEAEWGAGMTHPANPALLRSFLVVKTTPALAKDETITFTITKVKGTGSGLLHAYDVTEKGVFLDHVPKNTDGSIKGTMTSPGNSLGSMTVGAYDTRNIFDLNNDEFFIDATRLMLSGDLAPFSSRGPTRDGRPGISFLAPGNYIESTMTGHITECQKTPTTTGCQPLVSRLTKNGTYIAEGTSMASPMVTGATALMLQKDPTAFVRPLFQATAQSPAWATTKPADMWGAGLLRMPEAFDKWNKGKAPQIKLETADGKTVGLAPFKVTLKATVQNGTTVSEYFWDLDGQPGNDEIGVKNTTETSFTKLGKHTVSVVAVGDTGRTTTATLQLEVVNKLPEQTGETTNTETKSDAGTETKPEAKPGPEAKPEPGPEPVKESKPEPTADTKAGTETPTTDTPSGDTAVKGGCQCDASPSAPIPTHGILLGLFFLFALFQRRRERS